MNDTVDEKKNQFRQFMESYRRYLMIASGALFLFGILVFVFPRVRNYSVPAAPPKRTIVVEEKLEIPQTERVSGIEGRTLVKGKIELPVKPADNEEYVIRGAVLTLKGSFEAAKPAAEHWASDAKLFFIKSRGAVDPRGKSSQWQLVFGSRSKKKGYEIVIRADAIVSSKEIESASYGFDVPVRLIDSDEALQSIQNLPQFSTATISSITLYYNADGKKWGYGFATSRGTTSLLAQ